MYWTKDVKGGAPRQEERMTTTEEISEFSEGGHASALSVCGLY